MHAVGFRCWPHAARSTDEEAAAELAFEQRDALADRRLADTEIVRGLGEAAGFNDSNKRPEGVDAIHIFSFGMSNILIIPYMMNRSLV